MSHVNSLITNGHADRKFTLEQVADQVDAALSHFHSNYLSSSGIFGNHHSEDGELTELTRRELVRDSRRSYGINPACKQILKLYVNYGVSSGASFIAKGGKTGTDGKVTRKTQSEIMLEAILANPRNKTIFSTFGQRKTATNGLKAGENFFSIHGSGKQTVFRRVDALSIFYDDNLEMTTGIATNPEDIEEPRYYVQTIESSDGSRKMRVYRDWANDKWEDGELPDGTTIKVKGKGKDREAIFIKPGENPQAEEPITAKVASAQMYHWLFDGEGQRGMPLLNTSLAWCDAQSSFMIDRLAVSKGITRFLVDAKTKGGAAGVAAVNTQYASTLSNTNSNEGNPPPTAGSYRVHNSAVDFSAVSQETGADCAQVDGDAIMGQAALGAGIYNQFMGRGNLQNYAQANSMEGPMFKQFSAYVSQLEDMYETLFAIAGVDVEANTEELIRKDTPAMLDGITKLMAAMLGLSESDELSRQLFKMFGIKNEDIVIAEVNAAREKAVAAEQEAQKKQAQRPAPKPGASE